jgi:hypothetical protein
MYLNFRFIGFLNRILKSYVSIKLSLQLQVVATLNDIKARLYLDAWTNGQRPTAVAQLIEHVTNVCKIEGSNLAASASGDHCKLKGVNREAELLNV